MVAIYCTPVGRGGGRPLQRVDGRGESRAAGRTVLPLPVGPLATRTLLTSFYPDDDFRRKSYVNLPLVLFALLALLCLVGVVWSLRQ